ncbi:MAG TPA: ATP-binding cassette domain-containing protein [Rhodopila sp.]|jgi:branched-chain amino acid transport system ATP-binding protein
MIRIDNLSVRFGGVRPLDGLSADLTASIVGLIGPNGAGKTTLLNVFSGFVRPQTGEITMNGVAITRLSPARRVALGLRRIFQQEMVVDELTLRENVEAIADHVVADPSARRAEVDRALAFVGLSGRSDRPGRTLALFERRMVEIAKTLIGQPKVVLMDEPGAGLNEAEAQQLRTVLLGIPDTFGAQLVLIDHDADLIAAVCTETLVLDFGKRLALGPTRLALDDPAVRRAYLGSA